MERNTFWKIISKYGIEIPPIQRDFAQGRNTKKATQVRNNFLDSIINTLDTGTVLSLDFVYGKIFGLKNQEEFQRNVSAVQAILNSVKDYATSVDLKISDFKIEEKTVEKADVVYFIPLDGQQRLTTLYLIHWYIVKRLGKHEKLSILNRFKYKTRASSTAFISLLNDRYTDINFEVEREKICLEEGSFYKGILDLEYFSAVWLNDPTVKSMMNMLQAIHYRLQDKSHDTLNIYWTKLTVDDALHFSFLDLEDFNLSEELYVKMNARGKELSTFENFKAWLFGVIDSQGLFENNNGIWEEYKLKFDIEWNDIFWYNKATDSFNIDEAYFNYFKKRFLVDLTINSKIYKSVFIDDYEKSIIDQLYAQREDFDFENCFSKLFKSRVQGYFNTLDEFCKYQIQIDQLSSEIIDFKKFWFSVDVDLSWTDLIKNYAILSFIEHNAPKLNIPNFDFFRDYFRVISNLINNQTFDSPQLYQNALRDITIINRYIKFTGSTIYQWLDKIDDKRTVAFTKDQIIEERQKWLLINEDDAWFKIIIQAESHDLFKGKIGFIKGLAERNIHEFEDNYLHIYPLFNSDILLHPKKILQRCLLTFDNFFEKIGSDTYYIFKNDVSTYRSRRENWLGFLTSSPNKDLIYQLINHPLYDVKSPAKSLENIVALYKKEYPLEDIVKTQIKCIPFYKLFIYCRQLFHSGESNLIKLSHDKYAYQLEKSNTNGYFSDVILEFIKTVYFESDDAVKIFKTRGWDNSPKIIVRGFEIIVNPLEDNIEIIDSESKNSVIVYDTIYDVVSFIESLVLKPVLASKAKFQDNIEVE